MVCVGDSITAGLGASSSSTTYPSVLQELLGDHFVVTNLGSSGATMVPGPASYRDRPHWQAASHSDADVILLMLGTNDAWRLSPWSNDTFATQYLEMLDTLKSLPTEPYVYTMLPPPLYRSRGQTIINEFLPELITNISIASGLFQPINVFEALGGEALAHPEFFRPDGVHPVDAGYSRIARAVKAVMDIQFA